MWPHSRGVLPHLQDVPAIIPLLRQSPLAARNYLRRLFRARVGDVPGLTRNGALSGWGSFGAATQGIRLETKKRGQGQKEGKALLSYRRTSSGLGRKRRCIKTAGAGTRDVSRGWLLAYT